MTALTIIGEPHLDREFPEAGLTTFINHLTSPILLHSLKVNGPFWNQLQKQDAQVSILDILGTRRPRISPEPTRHGPNQISVPSAARNTAASPIGFRNWASLKSVSLEAGRDCQPWAAELLALEAAGWKGKRGTAIATNPAVEAAFMKSCQLLAAAGKLRFWKLALQWKNHRHHAMPSSKATRLGSARLPMTRTYAKFSPGVLLVLHATEKLFAESGVALCG